MSFPFPGQYKRFPGSEGVMVEHPEPLWWPGGGGTPGHGLYDLGQFFLLMLATDLFPWVRLHSSPGTVLFFS